MARIFILGILAYKGTFCFYLKAYREINIFRLGNEMIQPPKDNRRLLTALLTLKHKENYSHFSHHFHSLWSVSGRLLCLLRHLSRCEKITGLLTR